MELVPRTVERLGAHPLTLTARAVLDSTPAQHSLGGLWGGSQILLASCLRDPRQPRLLLAPTDDEREEWDEALRLLPSPGGSALVRFPACESPGRRSPGDLDARNLSERLAALAALGSHGERGLTLLASVQAILQPIPSAEHLRADMLSLARSNHLDEERLFTRLFDLEYERVPQVAQAGEFARRGDIIDLFPHGAEAPVRIELFDEEIDSLRRFDPLTQRSLEVVEHIEIFIGVPVPEQQPSYLFEILPAGCGLIETSAERMDEILAGLLRDPREEAVATRWLEARERLPRVRLHTLPTGGDDFTTLSVDSLCERTRRESLDGLSAVIRAGEHETLVLVPTAAEASRLQDELSARQTPSERFELATGSLRAGFCWPELALTVVHHHELGGRRPPRRPQRTLSPAASAPIDSFLELHEGDHVVHSVHGIGRFLRTETLEQAGGLEEFMVLLYAREALLYVPLARIDLVQRYVGASGAPPRLDRLGGRSFANRKLKALGAVRDLAADLLEIQARRASAPGFAFAPEDDLECAFVAEFPFDETPDQGAAWEAVRRDMESPRPMDRLICGDVGYGKTEIAMRAAFKAALSGKQTALLVPTTILAQQHLESFRERFADFPIEVDMISRFRKPAEQREILERTALGEVDVLIGTHRILSADVIFADLGLLVIDEEQRFGVTHKERLKKMRSQLDILTMTATPIPRTLHLSLVGLRDISALTTAPAGRREIDTRIATCDDDRLIAESLRRELHRGGQAFFLHNRVQTIGTVAARLARLVPEAKILVGHGQMPEARLEEVMTRFAAGEADVLLATTIIESGLDIPRANTILIDRAERFGLAEMHQLRGRVGRWKHKAYCRLLIPPGQPLSREARARLKAIEEYRELGAGFRIAMRDLEIRGAGNLLGAEQSGHIAAIGYELYCRLLKRVVQRRIREGATTAPAQEPRPRATPRQRSPREHRMRAERGFQRELEEVGRDTDAYLELGVEAYLPPDYVPDRDLRLRIYRELDAIEDRSSRLGAAAALRDRFGHLPEAVDRLLDVFELKRALGKIGVRRVRFAQTHYLLEFDDARALELRLQPHFPDIRVLAAGKALMMLPRHASDARRALKLLLRALDHEPARELVPRAGGVSSPPRGDYTDPLSPPRSSEP